MKRRTIPYLLVMVIFASDSYSFFSQVTETNLYASNSYTDTIFDKKITVYGSLTGENIVLTAITVVGSAQLTNSTVHGETKIYGSLKTDNSTFDKKLTLRGKAFFHNSTTRRITVKNGRTDKYNYELSLSGNTVVKGSIIFKGKKGIVYLFDDAQITGRVINGSVSFR